MDPMLEALNAGLPDLGLSLPAGAAETMCAFGQALLEKNQVMNLTAITEPRQVAQLHFLDSLTLLTLADFRHKQVIDVGCGGGFPGVPLKIACPDMGLTLLDSLGKRMTWLSQTLPALGIDDAVYLTARAEEAVASRREQYDFAVSRAVAYLPILCELCLPYVKTGGAFLAMKGGGSAGRNSVCPERHGAFGRAIGKPGSFFHRRGGTRRRCNPEGASHSGPLSPPLW